MYRSRYGDANFQEKVQAVSSRISAVLEDYERSTPERPKLRGRASIRSPAEEFEDETTQMQTEVAGLLAQVEDRTRNRMQALGAVQASLSSLGSAQALSNDYMQSLSEKSGATSSLLALRGPGADVRGHDISEGRKAAPSITSGRWQVDTKGFDTALQSAFDGRSKLASNFDNVVTLFRRTGLAGSEAMRKLKAHIKELMEKLDAAHEELRLGSKKVNRLTLQGKDLMDELSRLKMKLKRSERERDEAEQQMHDSERSRIAAEEKLKSVDADLQTALAVAQGAEHELSSMRRAKEGAERRLNSMAEKVQTMSKQMRAIQASMSGGNKRDQDRGSNMLEMIEELQKLRDEAKAFPAQMQQAIDEALAKQAEEHEADIQRHVDEAMAEAAVDNDRMRDRQNELQEQINKLTADNRALRIDQINAEEERKEMEAKLEQSKLRVKELQHKMDDTKAALRKISSKSSMPAPTQSFRIRSDGEVNRIASSCVKKEGLPIILDAVFDDLIAAAAHDMVTQELADAAAQKQHMSETEKLRSRIAELERNAATSDKLHHTEEELSKARHHVQELAEENEKLHTEHKALLAQLHSAHDANEALEAKVARAKKMSEKYQHRYTKLEMALDHGDSERILQMEAHTKAMEKELREQKMRMHDMRVELDAVKVREANLTKAMDRAGLATPATKARREGVADMYSDMREVGVNTEDMRVSSGCQTGVTGADLEALQAKVVKIEEEQEDDGTVSGALARWSKSRLAEEYQKLRRIAWDIRNENARLVAANKEYKAKVDQLQPAVEKLQRNNESSAIIARAMSNVHSGSKADVMRALANVRASVEHRLHEVRSAANLAVGELQTQLQQQQNRQVAKARLRQVIQASRVINLMKPSGASKTSLSFLSRGMSQMAGSHNSSPMPYPLAHDQELEDLIDHRVTETGSPTHASVKGNTTPHSTASMRSHTTPRDADSATWDELVASRASSKSISVTVPQPAQALPTHHEADGESESEGEDVRVVAQQPQLQQRATVAATPKMRPQATQPPAGAVTPMALTSAHTTPAPIAEVVAAAVPGSAIPAGLVADEAAAHSPARSASPGVTAQPEELFTPPPSMSSVRAAPRTAVAAVESAPSSTKAVRGRGPTVVPEGQPEPAPTPPQPVQPRQPAEQPQQQGSIVGSLQEKLRRAAHSQHNMVSGADQEQQPQPQAQAAPQQQVYPTNVAQYPQQQQGYAPEAYQEQGYAAEGYQEQGYDDGSGGHVQTVTGENGHPLRQGMRHTGDQSWLNVGMGDFDPWEDLQQAKAFIARAEEENRRLVSGMRELKHELQNAVVEGEAWKVAAGKLDRRLKSKELEQRVYNAVEADVEFGDAVAVLQRNLKKLRKNLDAGHVDFSYLSKFVDDVNSRSLRSLNKLKQRVLRRQKSRVPLPDSYAQPELDQPSRSSVSSGLVGSTALKPKKGGVRNRRRGQRGKASSRRRDPAGEPQRSARSLASNASGVQFEPMQVSVSPAPDTGGRYSPAQLPSMAEVRGRDDSPLRGGDSGSVHSSATKTSDSREPAKARGKLPPTHRAREAPPRISARHGAQPSSDAFLPLLSPSAAKAREGGLGHSVSEGALPRVRAKGKAGSGYARNAAAAVDSGRLNKPPSRDGSWNRLPLGTRGTNRSPTPATDRSYGPWSSANSARGVAPLPGSPADRARR